MNRQQANRELVKIFSAFVEAYPDLRFSQILGNWDFVKLETVYAHTFESPEYEYRHWLDEYNLEPQELLKRVKKAVDKMGV